MKYWFLIIIGTTILWFICEWFLKNYSNEEAIYHLLFSISIASISFGIGGYSVRQRFKCNDLMFGK